MAFTINTNITSLQAQNYLRATNDFQSKTINRVTSGLRIVTSGDDAAGLAIANTFRSDGSVLAQGVRNANDGLSQLQTADSGINNISQLLDRARTLATQSASGAFTGDRTVLNSEFQSVIGEIDRQAQAVGLTQGGTFAKNLNVFIGGGQAANGVSATTNGSISVDLSQSGVDAKSLGLKGVQAIGTAATDIGSGSVSTKVSDVVANTTNTGSEAAGGFTDFYFSGPGFSGANKVRVSVNLAGVTDTSTLVTAINAAIQNSTPLKNAGVAAAVNTDASLKQQLTFNGSQTAFQVQAGDRVANALLGNFSSGSTGKDLAATVTGTGVTVAGSTTSNVIIRIQGSGLAAPVDLTIASGSTTAAGLTALATAVTNSAALQAAGVSLSGTSAVGSTLTFTNKRGESFSASTIGDTANLFGLGTFSNATAGGASFDYTSITGAAGTFAATAQTLEFSIGGGAAVSLAVTPSAATVAGAIDALNTAFSNNATLSAAGLHASLNGAQVQIDSNNGTAFRINALAGGNIFGFGTGAASVAGSATVGSVAADNTNNVHFDTGGESASAVFQFHAILNGQDAQTLTFSARDTSGAEQSTQVVLQNNGTARNARSLDEVITTINSTLQQTNNATLKQIVAVKEYIDATHEGIRFVSTLSNFNASLGAAGTGGAVGIGLAGDQGKVYTSAATTGGSTSDISTQGAGQNAVAALAASISLLGKAQGVVGRGQNQFTYAINLAQSQITNLAAAESRIRDADLAFESANLTKAQILTQAGIAALAQANSAPQQVLTLLRG